MRALGNYYCIGKNLAYKEMQYLVSLLVSKYDIRLAPGETGRRVVDDMLDQFTAAPGKLGLVFERRKMKGVSSTKNWASMRLVVARLYVSRGDSAA